MKTNHQKEKIVENQINDLMKIIKEKDEEIESLYLTGKITVDNGTKLLEINKQLEKEVRELKTNCVKSNKDDELKYSCDKCDNSFKTAGLQRRHIKNEHGIA